MPEQTKLEDTPKLADILVNRWRITHSKRAAYLAANLSAETLDRYLERGEKGEEPFAAFAERWKKAEADWISERCDTIHDAQKAGVWTAAAWDLERHLPHEFGLKQRIEHSGDESNPVVVKQSGRLELTGDAALAVIAFHEAQAEGDGEDSDPEVV